MENATPIPHNGQTPSANASSAQRGHETSDAKLRPIVLFIAVMFAAAIVVQIIVWWLMRGLEHGNAQSDPAASPFVDSRTPPTKTPLQPSIGHPNQPFEDMNDLRARWNKEQSSYGPVPGHPEQARIPLDRAMQIMVSRGISSPTPSSSPASRPATLPGGTP